jgi:hypothetical protein
MKKNAVWLVAVVFAVLVLVIGATGMVTSLGATRVADGVAPTPNPIPMCASVATNGATYFADGVAPTPDPIPMA